MSTLATISGAGGGKGGSSYRAAVEDPNTLQSKTIARLVDVICEGPIQELTAKRVYFNETPLETAEGITTFQGTDLFIRYGEPEQAAIPFTTIEAEIAVDAEITHDNPKGSNSGSGAVMRTINNLNVGAVRIKIALDGLTQSDKTNADLHGYNVEIRISVNGNPIIQDNIEGKTTSTYVKSYRINLNTDGPWDIKVERISEDVTQDATIKNNTYWQSYTEIIEAQLTYPDTAVVGIQADAQFFGNQIPTRQYLVKGLLVKVPSNYNPVTRTYSGVYWDGTFKTAWTNNPAWCLYDLMCNTTYGVGQFVNVDHIDKFALYEIAQYCDELVDDGFGGQEPRFTFNYAITGRDEAIKTLRALASIFRGMIFYGPGMIVARADQPRDVKFLANAANVKNSEFHYSSTGFSSRHSVVIATWQDPKDLYNDAREIFDQPELVVKYGWKPLEIATYGCTSRGQALRFCKWALLTEQLENETVRYVAGMDHFKALPGDIVEISDPNYQNTETGGRLVQISANGYVITLDRAFKFESTKQYFLSVLAADGTILKHRIASTSTTTETVNISTPVDRTKIVANAVYIISSSSLAPRQFRILNKVRKDNEFEIEALFYDPRKYDIIERGLVLEAPIYYKPLQDTVPAPTNLTAIENTYWVNGVPRQRLTISWTPSAHPATKGYNVQVQPPANSWRNLEVTKIPSVDFDLDGVGQHNIKVQTVLLDNRTSTWATTSVNAVGKDVPPGKCSNLTAEGWFGSIWLTWTNPTDTDISHIEIWENTIDDLATATHIADVKGTSYQRNLGSFQGRYYWVRAKDTSGNVGEFNAEAGTYGYSEQASHQDFVDYLLEHNPYLQQAIDDLNTPIEAIELDLAEIKDITIPDISTDIKDIKEVVIPDIDTKIADLEISLPDAIQKLSERIRGIDESVMGELTAVSASAVEALLNISETNGRITDAGILVDPETGEVRIWAVDQLKQETELRLVNAEMLISAQDAKISQKVSLAEVDARIAEAVFGDVGELLVSGLDARINTVQDELNATNAELVQKATQVEVNALGGRVGDAEVRISGAESDIALKATKIEVGEIGTRVTNAESSIDALNGQITQTVTAIGQEGKDLANLTAEGLVEAILNDTDNHELAKASLAMAKEELYANIEDGLEAEAGHRLQLAAVVDGNKALILEEQTVRATQHEAIASSVESLITKVGNNETAIQTEAEARSTETSSQGAYTFGMISQLTNDVSEALVGDILNQAEGREVAKKQYAVIRQEYNTKIEEGLLSEATKRETLAVKLGEAEAAIQEESRVRVTQDAALAESVKTMGVRFGEDIGAAIQEERIVRVTAEGALADEIHTVKSKADDNEAAIQTVSKTFADESSATGSHVFTLVSRLTDQTAEGLVDDILNQAEGRDVAKEQYAIIREEYDTKIEEGILSEATKRELLAVKLGEAEAAIQEERRVTVDENRALAESIDSVQAKLGNSFSAVNTVERAISEQETALAEQITTLAASTISGEVSQSATPPTSPTLGQVYFNTTDSKYYRWTGTAWEEVKGLLGNQSAVIQQINRVKVNGVDMTLAESLTTLASSVGDNTTKVNQTATSVNGVLGKAGVKIDSNGYVTGWELIGGANSGAMVVHADVFAVGRPGATKQYPFMIGTVNGTTRVSMNNAFIQDAAIVNAKIGNAAVDTIKIAGHSVSDIVGDVRTDTLYFNTMEWFLLNEVYVKTEVGYPVTILFSGTFTTSEAATELTLTTAYGRRLLTVNPFVASSGNVETHTGSAYAVDNTPSTSNAMLYRAYIRITGGDPDMWRSSHRISSSLLVTSLRR